MFIVPALLWISTITPGVAGSAAGFQLLPPLPLLLGTARTLLSAGKLLNHTVTSKQKIEDLMSVWTYMKTLPAHRRWDWSEPEKFPENITVYRNELV